MKTKKAFCAGHQEVTDHEVTIDANGEYLFTCECGRFFKIPADSDKAAITAFLSKHEKTNKGQLSVEEVEKANKAKLDLI